MSFPMLKFVASSANFDKYPELTIKSAEEMLEGINSLLKLNDYNQKIYEVSDFNCENNENVDTLQDLLNKYRSDKASSHNYYKIYAFILEKLGVNNKLNLLEIGLGTNNPNLVSTMGSGGNPGASILAFRDFLPNSNIYGADVDKNILFNSERIKTFFVDQLDRSSFKELSENMYDVIIDDGLHSTGANLNTLLFAIEHIRVNGWIIIEDISDAFKHYENWFIIDYILKNNTNFKTYLVKCKVSYVYVLNKIK
jgi:hypothetical protein